MGCPYGKHCQFRHPDDSVYVKYVSNKRPIDISPSRCDLGIRKDVKKEKDFDCLESEILNVEFLVYFLKNKINFRTKKHIQNF